MPLTPKSEATQESGAGGGSAALRQRERARKKRREELSGLAAIGILGLFIAVTWIFLPPEPAGPRYMGAGAEEGSPHYGGTLYLHHSSDVHNLDPHVAFDEISGLAIKLLFEGLIDYDHDLNFVPRLAEEVPTPSADGLTYRFRLRDDVRFSHGRVVEAEDVRWSMERMLSAELGSPGFTFYTLIEGLADYRAGRAEHISGIRVLDRRTVEFQLTQPSQTFLYAMAMQFAYPVPREIYTQEGHSAWDPVGTGAFVLESWEPGVRLVFRRNPRFFEEGRPYLERVVYELNLTRETAVLRFRNGELDHIHRQTPADYRFLKNSREWQPYLMEYPLTNLWGIEMNCQMAPFDNVHLRRAVAHAINGPRWRRARANRLLLSGQPIPRNLPAYDPELEGAHRFDLGIARREMREAGYPDGLPEPVEVWLGEGPTGRLYGELIQQDLREIGIDVQIRQAAFPVYLRETGKPHTAQMLLGGWNMDFPDPANFLDILFHSDSIHDHDSENRSFYSNPALDRLLDDARIERDPARRTRMYQEAARILVRDAPWAFVWNDLIMEVRQPYVRNYRPHPVWSFFMRDAWLDLPRRRIAQNTGPNGEWAAALRPFSRRPFGPARPAGRVRR